jgi:hypothetical protein
MKHLRLLAAASLLAALASGCASSTSSTPGSGTPLVSAKPGSVFNLEVTYTDSNGNNLRPTDQQYDSVMATGITFQGKTNVVQIYQSVNGTPSTGYYAILDNGDLAIYAGQSQPGMKSQWVVLPFGTGASTTTVILDTTITNGLAVSQSKETATYSHASSTTVTVAGTTLTCDGVRGQYETTSTVSIPGYPAQTTKTILPDFYYYWSRDIGFVAKSISTSSYGFNGTMHVTQTLKSYTVR